MDSETTDDPFGLRRFEDAQEPAIGRVLDELRAGRKASHWMWFVFPQIAGLGLSEISRRYAISGIEEARAYLAHPVLGPRLRECCAVLLRLSGATAREVFGLVDAVKLRSCMTLFAAAAGGNESVFQQVLDRYFAGAADPATTARL
ncbi:MAG: DUF1810 domain-containing protein [Proteobacteria bacterium]|nr:DUF1810 domain-containing protein [Pseudomonadota bacterium]